MAGKNNALQKPVNLSPQLENVVGKGPMTRAQVTSKVWDHIKDAYVERLGEKLPKALTRSIGSRAGLVLE